MILNNGIKMPDIGLGTFKARDEDAYNATLWALEAGYRHIDTARVYKNEKFVGNAIKDSKIKREDLFITTKLSANKLGYASTKNEIDASLNDLGLSYIDLYLIHWPSHNEVTNAETYLAMEEAYQLGKIRSLGVSNFSIHHLDNLLKTAKIIPTVNQVELHPFLNQEPLRKYCENKGIKLISYGPLAKGKAFENESLKELSKKYQKSIVNIIVRWGLQRGIFMIPKSIHQDRIIDNLKVFDFNLTEEDMQKIMALNVGHRVYTDPDNNPLSI